MSDQPKVQGIGGVFFKARDPAAQRRWYAEHLGLRCGEYGTNFAWRSHRDPERECHTVWAPFSAATDYFEPSKQPFMINFRVDDLKALLRDLQEAGIEPVGEVMEESYGKFAHVMDPEGNKIELWEPVEPAYREMLPEDEVTGT